MSTDSPTADVHADKHAAEEHGHDEHGEDDPVVGPVDVPAWAAAVGGILIGAAVALCFMLATAPA